MNYFIDAVTKKYALLEGRARRKEFWMYVLFYFIGAIVFGFICGLIHLPWLGYLYTLGLLPPTIAVSARRMHDTDHSGWWQIVPVAGLIFTFLDGTPGTNRFGENPKGVSDASGVAG